MRIQWRPGTGGVYIEGGASRRTGVGLDRELREIERRFEEQPDEALAAELRRGYERLGVCLPPRLLRKTARWKPLVEFVARWYEEPLGDECGNSEEELRAAEARGGGRLPEALREWYRLVGRRLRFVSDTPIRLEEVQLSASGLLRVWVETQGVWVVSVPSESTDPDPEVVITRGFRSTGRLAETVTGLIGSETLVGAMIGHLVGPLGDLGAEVRGGLVFFAEAAQIAGHYGRLPWPAYPSFAELPPARGDRETVMRYDGAGIEWMTATQEAFERLRPAFDLEKSDLYELVVRFRGLSKVAPSADPFGAFSRAGVRSRLGGNSEHAFDVLVQTADPRGDFERVRANLPAVVVESHLTAAFNSDKLRTYTTLWPQGARFWSLA